MKMKTFRVLDSVHRVPWEMINNLHKKIKLHRQFISIHHLLRICQQIELSVLVVLR